MLYFSIVNTYFMLGLVGGIVTIFKLTERAMKELANRKQLVRVKEEKKLVNEQLQILNSFIKTIRSGGWSANEQFVTRVLYTLRYGISASAKHFNTSENSTYVCMSKASKAVESIVGADFVSVVLDGNIGEGWARLDKFNNTETYPIKQLLIMEVVEPFEKAENAGSTFSLSECTQELKFLKMCTKNRFKELCNKVDTNRMAYLLNLGVGDNYTDKRLLSLFLSGDITLEEVIEKSGGGKGV